MNWHRVSDVSSFICTISARWEHLDSIRGCAAIVYRCVETIGMAGGKGGQTDIRSGNPGALGGN